MRVSRYFIVLTAVWMLAMTWRLYPGFADKLRLDGRVIAFSDYIDESCGERIGPEAESCLELARASGQRLLAREQARAILLIDAPLFAYLLGYLPLRLLFGARRSRGAGMKTAIE